MPENPYWGDGDVSFADGRRVLQLLPAEPGWRVVLPRYSDPTPYDAASKRILELLLEQRIISWALVEVQYRFELYHLVEPVYLDDFPPTTRIGSCDEEPRYGEVGILAPGQELDEDWRDTVVQMARASEREKARREKEKEAAHGT
jgi:hypothetical protein